MTDKLGGNGQGPKLNLKDLTLDEKLDAIIEALCDLQLKTEEGFGDLNERLDETNEKVSNLSLDGDGFQIGKYDS